MKSQPSDGLAIGVLGVAVAMLVILFWLAGCTPKYATRLNPGECLVIIEASEVTTVGQDCSTKRFNR